MDINPRPSAEVAISSGSAVHRRAGTLDLAHRPAATGRFSTPACRRINAVSVVLCTFCGKSDGCCLSYSGGRARDQDNLTFEPRRACKTPTLARVSWLEARRNRAMTSMTVASAIADRAER
jgi:hypothetical protein